MTERPITFNTAMVRAILDGRKTQTRRADGLDAVNANIDGVIYKGFLPNTDRLHWFTRGSEVLTVRAPYAVGDVLWVRETWAKVGGCEPGVRVCQVPQQEDAFVIYAATSDVEYWDDGDGYALRRSDGSLASCWRPSIHMPRWAARLFLCVTEVRAERLQDISEKNARREGTRDWLLSLGPRQHDKAVDELCRLSKQIDPGATVSNRRGAFAAMWNSIYAKRGLGWDANPWVWVRTFERVEQPAAHTNSPRTDDTTQEADGNGRS